jgi:nucleotide-binding universal stress UspA family protein
MFRRILVPLDGSARAEQALPIAARPRTGIGRITSLTTCGTLLADPSAANRAAVPRSPPSTPPLPQHR